MSLSNYIMDLRTVLKEIYAKSLQVVLSLSPVYTAMPECGTKCKASQVFIFY